MQASEEKTLTMDVYSTREQAGRSMPHHCVGTRIVDQSTKQTVLTEHFSPQKIGVEMIPTRLWGDGTGGLLGCSIRFCMFDAINDVVWHILVTLCL